MGLSSSQARLLNLTSRMHQIEYKAAKLEAEKLQMANESNRVYEEYLDALDKSKIQYKVLTTDGSITYQDINSYDDFLDAGYALCYKGEVYSERTVTSITFSSVNYLVTGSHKATAEEATRFFLGNGIFQEGDPVYETEGGYLFVTHKGSPGTMTGIDPSGQKNTSGGSLNYNEPYDALCKAAFGADTPPTNVSDVITNLINSGEVTIVSKRKDGTFPKTSDDDFGNYETSVSTNTGLQEVNDKSVLRKAEAKYEADMKKIDLKDRKYDSDLAALDAERNAIKSEMETLRNVAKENVDRTFKLFS